MSGVPAVRERCPVGLRLHLGVCGRSVLQPWWHNGSDEGGLGVDSVFVRLGVCFWRPSTLATGAGAIGSTKSGFALLLSLCVRLSPSPPRGEGVQGGVLCRRFPRGCEAAATLYAEIVLPARLMGYVLRLRGRHAQGAFGRT